MITIGFGAIVNYLNVHKRMCKQTTIIFLGKFFKFRENVLRLLSGVNFNDEIT